MITLSQTKVKAFEATTCKRLFQAEFATGEITREPNEYMMRGLYLEQEGLGGSAHSQEKVTLPRLRSGEKSVAHNRLDAQALRFRALFNPESPEYLGWQITDRQLLLKDGNREGTLDFVCRRDGVVSVWDLKCTEDLTNSMGWGNPEKLDFLQQAFYRHLYMTNFGIDPELYLIVMDYSTQERCKIIKLNLSDEFMDRSLYRFDEVAGTLLELDLLEEYPRIPAYMDCKRCSLSCRVRMVNPGIDFTEITI